jgi:hypothetical protein
MVLSQKNREDASAVEQAQYFHRENFIDKKWGCDRFPASENTEGV